MVLTANTPELAVDSDTQLVVEVDGINFNNQDSAPSTYGYAFVPAGETLAAKHYYEFQSAIGAKEAIPFTGSLVVRGGAKLYVVAGNSSTTVKVTKAS